MSSFNIVTPTKCKLVLQLLFGFFIRLTVWKTAYIELFQHRIEISTPLNSWQRVTESVDLFSSGINPYIGDNFHEPPLNLYIYSLMIKLISINWIPYLFIFTDIITAVLLFKTAKGYLKEAYQSQRDMFDKNDALFDKNKDNNGVNSLSELQTQRERLIIILKETDIQQFALYCSLVYLFNPFSIMNCIAQTTTVFSNLIYASFLYSLVYEHYWASIICLSLGTSQSLYPITLVAPMLLKFCMNKDGKWHIFQLIFTVLLFVLHLLGLAAVSRFISGGWSYIDNVYLFVLNIGNLCPNIGLFWYFFTEMFEHFHHLFIAAFQINMFILYVVPLSVRFRKDIIFLCTSLIMLNAIFKSYPSMGDVGLYLALVPMWYNLLPYLQQAFIVTVVLFITLLFGPIVWDLWTITGTANANFYFGITLCFAAAEIFLVTDLLFAYIKREFWLSNNCKGMTEEMRIRLVLE